MSEENNRSLEERMDKAMELILINRYSDKEDTARFNYRDLKTTDFLVENLGKNPDQYCILDPSVLFPFHLVENPYSDPVIQSYRNSNEISYISDILGDIDWLKSVHRIINATNFALGTNSFVYEHGILEIVTPFLKGMTLKCKQIMADHYRKYLNSVLEDFGRSSVLGKNALKEKTKNYYQDWFSKHSLSFAREIGQEYKKVHQSLRVCSAIVHAAKYRPVSVYYSDARQRKFMFYQAACQYLGKFIDADLCPISFYTYEHKESTFKLAGTLDRDLKDSYLEVFKLNITDDVGY